MVKVVISTHKVFKNALAILLKSLDYKDHLDDIIVCVNDTPIDQAQTLIQEYIENFQLKNVITYHTNIDEYTAYMGLAQALHDGKFSDEERFIVLHDTMEVGSRFWKALKDIDKKCKPNLELTKQDAIYKANMKLVSSITYRKGLRIRKFKDYYVTDEFKFVNHKLKTLKHNKYLGENMTLVDKKQAIYFENEDAIDNIKNIKFRLYPISTNFNLAISTKEFLMNEFYDAYKDVQFSKEESINIELCIENKRNLKNLAKRWIYADADMMKAYFPSSKNNIEMYGKLRCVSYVTVLDIRKYLFYLHKDLKHDTRN